ncbi:HoxN/HupN/NixA family nickel/cobalt transporter [Paracraurococcus lichenis]|uniref:Nickel/cobalt efflux system n=1 Tax=Paracraurococcus lichenis TaxID=3064888 RepID=A0ABT9E6X6_9PROT|nr:hypothetical protein [Paracraurococcus sp. LOR1-02]MDO9711884.1 hypothetical protein [Paracraurococcus sp. LOR1-02]
MLAALSLSMLGFFLGMRHATDPDHVVAVSTIVARQPSLRAALLIGSLWGLGHSLTIVAVGGAIILFAAVIPPRLGVTMEMGVALMLIVLGMWNLTGVLERIRASAVDGASAPHPHPHPHPHGPGADAWPKEKAGLGGAARILRPLLIGLMHGLAGSAAVALLVLTLIQDPWWAVAYLAVFGIGTIAGMILITAAIAAALAYASRRSNWAGRYLPVTSGLLSLVFGLFFAYQVAVAGGLLGMDPGTSSPR